MPTISPMDRVTIGGEATKAHRTSITTSTGMNMPSLTPKTEGATAPVGQPGIKEDTTAPAVTLSPQLTALARKQQALQREIQAQRDKESAWEKEKAGYVPKSAFKDKLQQNAAEALKDLGVDYEEIARLMIEQSNGDDPVKSLRSEVDQLKKSQEDNANKQYNAILQQYKLEAEKLIKSDSKYFMISEEPEAAQAAVDELVSDWEATGETKELSYYLDLAEEGLRDVANKLSGRLKKTEPAPAETETKKTLPPPKQQAAPKTLTQQVEATPTRSYNQFQHLSPKERIAQAIARAQK